MALSLRNEPDNLRRLLSEEFGLYDLRRLESGRQAVRLIALAGTIVQARDTKPLQPSFTQRRCVGYRFAVNGDLFSWNDGPCELKRWRACLIRIFYTRSRRVYENDWSQDPFGVCRASLGYSYSYSREVFNNSALHLEWNSSPFATVSVWTCEDTYVYRILQTSGKAKNICFHRYRQMVNNPVFEAMNLGGLDDFPVRRMGRYDHGRRKVDPVVINTDPAVFRYMHNDTKAEEDAESSTTVR